MEKILFEVFIETFIEQELNTIKDKEQYKALIMDYFLKSLIYVINEQRISGRLKAKSSFLRYKEFDNKFRNDLEFYTNFKRNFKEIFDECIANIYEIENMKKEINNKFQNDRDELVNKGLISPKIETLESLKLEIKGDVHNKKAVCVISTGFEKIVYKPKSTSSSKLIENILNILNHINPYNATKTFSFINFLDKEDYYWEQFVNSEFFKKEQDIKGYYYSLGGLLFIAYILNISDLHFENVLVNSHSPVLVDLETIFSITPYEVVADNKATRSIILENTNSVLATGLLPVSSSFKYFGGDTSGILGGKYLKEEVTVKNKFRDNIKLVKQIKKCENYGNIPLILDKNKKKKLVDPLFYTKEIKLGFKNTFDIFREKKNIVVDTLDALDCKKTAVRLLYRNTKDYAVIKRLFSSPLYYNKKEELISKLSVLKTNKINISEKKQLLDGSIPYFYVYHNDIKVYDVYRELVDYLYIAPLDAIKEKIEHIDEKIILKEMRLIDFSFKSQELFYSNKEKSIIRKEVKNIKLEEKDSVNIATRDILDKIMSNSVINKEDGSINWKSIGVGKNDQIELKPLNYSLYNGISGLGYMLLLVYKYNTDKNVLNCLKHIFNTCFNYVEKNMSKDYSYYNGSLGILKFLFESSQLCGDREKIKVLFNYYINAIQINKILNLDIIAGITGIGITLLKSHSYYCDRAMIKVIKDIFELLKNELETNKKNIFNSSLSDNVSLAHGKIGITVFLYYYYVIMSDKTAYKYLAEILKECENKKISSGWIDNRKNNRSSSANWCHGSTGVLVAMVELLKADRENRLLNEEISKLISENITHSVENILEIGIDMNNFCLCHGVSGNLLSLLLLLEVDFDGQYQKKYKLNSVIDKSMYKLIKRGVSNNWLSGYGTEYHTFGLFTGIAGILYFLISYENKKSTI